MNQVIAVSIGLACLFGMALGYLTAYVRQSHTVKKLRKHNSELMAELRDGTTVTESQLTEYKRVIQEHLKLNEEQNNVVAYIRDNDPTVLGKYSSFSSMVIGLIEQLRKS